VYGPDNAVLPTGAAYHEQVPPVKSDTAAGRWIERRGGDAGYMAIFQTSDLADARAHVEGLGVRVVWEANLDPSSSSIASGCPRENGAPSRRPATNSHRRARR
jgi:hypothetical protein